MDMQFRNYFTQSNDDYIDGGNPHYRGGFLPFDTFLLANDYQLIEGGWNPLHPTGAFPSAGG